MAYFIQECGVLIVEIKAISTPDHANAIIKKPGFLGIFRKLSVWRKAGPKRIPPERRHFRIFRLYFDSYPKIRSLN